LRVFDKQYNKLLETQVTDSKGRYSFLVSGDNYYVTAEKSGYKKYQYEYKGVPEKKEKEEKEAEAIKEAHVISMDIGLEKKEKIK